MEIKKIIDDYQYIFARTRLDNHETVRDMAKKLGISISYLSLIENGQRKCPEKLMTILSAKYELDQKKVLKIWKKYDNIWTIINLSKSDKKAIVNCYEVLHTKCVECKYNTSCKEYLREEYRKKNGIPETI